MTEKNKYKLQKKLEKVKQLIIIGLMVLCGLWYVTKGREKDNSAYAFSEQKSSKIIIEKEGYGVDSDSSDDIETRASADNDSGDRINLNSATQKELESLPGVGPATAKNIIDYREKYGGFADVEEIKNVKRIGDKTYEKLKEYITV
ncbi:competence protein ComEA [Oribacterium sp. KHPX15]|uniref:ComEA family DNA-binding protein n=1 Tax=Oribacterium sp. KHPX15 TaxID=1855342 RepID=UPI00089C9D55|nr:helix-hairpin-helix domain-containing protein [Oribacterium sp. KHPX15]SEA32215.1 competence protein ComEA [Oribacterium sp. KHPX15]